MQTLDAKGIIDRCLGDRDAGADGGAAGGRSFGRDRPDRRAGELVTHSLEIVPAPASIAEALGRELEPGMLGQRQILDIRADLGAPGRGAQDTDGAMLADVTDADLLEVGVGAPLLDMVRVMRTEEGEAILLQNIIVPPDRQKAPHPHRRRRERH